MTRFLTAPAMSPVRSLALALGLATALSTTACAAPSDERESDPVPAKRVEQAASYPAGSCVLLSSSVETPGYIQNKNVCGESVEVLTIPGGAWGKIVTTRSCEALTPDEKDSMCGADYREYGDDACWLARVVRVQTDFYGGAGCGGGSSAATSDDERYEGSSSGGDAVGSRSDGCGFDAYGRWRCM